MAEDTATPESDHAEANAAMVAAAESAQAPAPSAPGLVLPNDSERGSLTAPPRPVETE